MASLKQTLTWVKGPRGVPSGSIVTMPEGTSESFKKGALVAYDLSENGIVEVARTAGVPDVEAAFGIALEDATGTAGTDLDVLIPGADDEFVVALASDQDTPVAPSIDSIGDAVGLVKLSTTGGAGTEYVAVPGVDQSDLEWARVQRLYGPDVEKRGGINATFSAGDRVVIRFGARAFMGTGVSDIDGQVA